MRSDETCRKLLDAIAALPLGETQIMEVCGTHTMAIAEAGIRSLLPKHIRLISGPGCPVCVTPPEDIDAVLELAMEPDVVLTSYGDMLRVPGSRRGDSLMRRRALGADVRIVYSPMDAVEIAAQEPGKQVVFLGVGFETTAPGTAAALLTAKERGTEELHGAFPAQVGGTGAARADGDRRFCGRRISVSGTCGDDHRRSGLPLPAGGVPDAGRDQRL